MNTVSYFTGQRRFGWIRRFKLFGVRMAWSFRKMSRGEMNADPVEGEFFTPEGLADSLVRESIQNSLDAKLDDSPVRVRFHFSGETRALSAKSGNRYLDGLWQHVKSIEGGRPNTPEMTDPVQFLTIEDFGTRGLCGSTEQDNDTDESGENKDFFYFWRNIGRSRKEESQRGRWGLGKTVFPAASRLNSFYGYTVRFDDINAYLMGQSVVKIHRINDIRYCPYGFYAKIEPDAFQRPLDDSEILKNFRLDFQLERTDEPGLSIVVPFPDLDEIDPDQMIRSAIIHYFYPILRGELIVEVSADGLDARIDDDSIDDIVDKIAWTGTQYNAEQMRHLFALVRRSIHLSDSESAYPA